MITMMTPLSGIRQVVCAWCAVGLYSKPARDDCVSHNVCEGCLTTVFVSLWGTNERTSIGWADEDEDTTDERTIR